MNVPFLVYYLIVIYHGGIEKFRYPSPEIRKRFHRMADNGADVILSQHTHCIGCEEWYNGSYLLYGQGDFLFNNFRPGLTDTGLIIEIEILDKPIINKYKVMVLDDYSVQMCDNQDLGDFIARSNNVNNQALISELFQQFCYNELTQYLFAFKSPNKFQRIIRKIYPSFFYKWLYKSAFTKRDLMFALHTLRSEQNRETAIEGIKVLLRNYQ